MNTIVAALSNYFLLSVIVLRWPVLEGIIVAMMSTSGSSCTGIMLLEPERVHKEAIGFSIESIGIPKPIRIIINKISLDWTEILMRAEPCLAPKA